MTNSTKARHPMFIIRYDACLLIVMAYLGSSYLPVWAQIIQQRRTDGRIYFTNLPATSAQSTRRSVVTVVPSLSRAVSPAISVLMQRLARQHNVDPNLVHAIITVESNYNPRAVSRAGAQGLMQLMPATAARFQVEDPFNPRDNMEGGIRYLKHLLTLFSDDLRHVLAAYNAGESAVYKYGGVPPYPETQTYVERVLGLYGRGIDRPRKVIYRYRSTSGSLLFTDTLR